MADDIDRANEQAQGQLEAALAHRKPVPNIKPMGECHWCGEEFEKDSLKLFCDGGCATRFNRAYGA